MSAGGIDAPVSALAVGATEDGDLASMLGTSTCNGFISHESRLSPRLVNMPYVVEDKSYLYSFAGLTTTGYCISLFRNQLAKREAELAKETGLTAYQILDLEAEKVPPGSDGLLFLPHMMFGERAPYWDNDVQASLMELTVYHTRAHIFRAILEGIAYALRYSVEVATEAGMPLRRALLVSGGAKSKLWRDILTDVSGLAMTYIARNPGAPLGDALLAGLGTGVIQDFKALSGWLTVTEITKQNLKNGALYNGYYDLFRKIYEANKNVYEELRRLSS